GLVNNGGTLRLINSTFSGNFANIGGGIFNSAITTMKSTIVANSPSGGNCFNNGSPPFISEGYNLSDDGSCSSFLNQSGDLNNTPAGLDPGGLKDNGGPTQTIALLATSPAVDHIPVSPINHCTDEVGNPVTTDQRGVS